jgi:predicted enzyme related to lactoylglutathione lyase
MPEFDYVSFQAAGGPGGGFTRVGEQVRPGTIFVYIQTDDIEASLADIESLG